MLSTSACDDDVPARCADGEPDRGLAAPGDRAGEQQVCDVGAGDEQHEAAHAKQNLQAAAVLLLHDPTPAPAGTTVITCRGNAWMTSGIQFAG